MIRGRNSAPAYMALVLLGAIMAGPFVMTPADSQMDSSRPVVIAYAGEGINPYHIAFRSHPWVLESWRGHPATFIEGYPTTAQPFAISLEGASFEDAWENDAAAWNSVVTGQLYFVPGTRIVGAVCVMDPSDCRDEHGFYDDSSSRLPPSNLGHGTSVVDAGSGVGGANPRSAIVVVRGAASVALEWVARNPWIDLVSVSSTEPVPPGLALFPWHSSEVVNSGRAIAKSGSNGGLGQTNLWYSSHPPWVLVVGQANVGVRSADGSQYHYAQKLHDRPVEVLGLVERSYAVTDSYTATADRGGTSFAAPTIAGHMARLVEEARAILGHRGGVTDGALAIAGPGGRVPAEGPLADGRLDRLELEQLVRASAVTFPLYDPWLKRDVQLENPQRYWYQGYGVFTEDSHRLASAVLRGERPMPDRSEDDAIRLVFEAAGRALWAPWSCGGQLELPDPSCEPPRS